ncbi:HEPN domain-containing protein [Candidatus Babeliales bacterium]|nr:HEPN domain-containing protein [Candidatus Babeliales bacterium]
MPTNERSLKTYLVITPFENPDSQTRARLLSVKSKQYYKDAMTLFNSNYFRIRTKRHHRFNLLWPAASSFILLYHLAIEIILKALIILKTSKEPDHTHNLRALLKTSVEKYPKLSSINDNSEYMQFLDELGPPPKFNGVSLWTVNNSFQP